jgi:hypothetical protein
MIQTHRGSTADDIRPIHKWKWRIEMNAQERLRARLLINGLYDDVPLAEIESVIITDKLAETLVEQQELALSSTRSLLDDGLMVFYGNENLSVDEAMAKVHDLYVTRYDDPGAWVFAMWLKLTDAGKRAAKALEAARDPD